MSSFRVGRVSCQPHLQKTTVQVMCRFEALGRGVCNLPLAEDKLFDINGALMWSTTSRNSWGKWIRSNHTINGSPSESYRRGTFKRTSVEPLKRMSWLAAAIHTQRRSNDPGVRSTTRGRCSGASFSELGDESDCGNKQS